MLKEIFSNRVQTKYFDEENIPSYEDIYSVLNDTYNSIPSKQNLMPYHAYVLGPERKKEKEILYKISTRSQDSDSNYTTVKSNFQLFAPYVIVFTQRTPAPNEFVLDKVKKGHAYKILHSDNAFDPGVSSQSILEVGMFASLLAGFCLEKNLAISFTKCFPTWYKKGKNEVVKNIMWNKIPFIKDPPHLIMSVGNYKDHWKKPGETKPDFHEVVSFIK